MNTTTQPDTAAATGQIDNTSPASVAAPAGVSDMDAGQHGGANGAPVTAAPAKRWEDMTPDERCADTRAKIDAMPPGFRGLYKVVWFCRENQMCSTALRLRAFLCSLYNGTAARKVDLSDIQHFDGNLRKHFAEVILHIGSHSSGLWDYEIRTAFKNCGIERYFDAGFPRRR